MNDREVVENLVRHRDRLAPDNVLIGDILAYGEAVRREQIEADIQACRDRVEFDLSQASCKERAGQHDESLRLTAQAAGAQMCVGDIIRAAAVKGEK